MQMVLDNRTYDQLEGRCRNLFCRLKWYIIKSVFKSVSGLQGKKVKVSQPRTSRSELVLDQEMCCSSTWQIAVKSIFTALADALHTLVYHNSGH